MNKWPEVTRAQPCAICGKPDWCLVAPDGRVRLCNRVHSERPAGGGGWLHGAPERVECPVPRRAPETYERPDFDAPSAALALERKVGARGLRMILEDLMLDLMYFLPSYKKVREFHVTKEMVLSQKINLALLEKAG